VAGAVPALEAGIVDGSLGPGDEAIGLGERRGLELRHEQEDIGRDRIPVAA